MKRAIQIAILFCGVVTALASTTSAQTIITAAGTGLSPTGFCGDGGPATDSCLHFPNGVAVDADGNLFIADKNNHRIRRVDVATGIITTTAGNGTGDECGDDGPATSACLQEPLSVTLDEAGDLFIADTNNQRIRRVDASTGIIITLAGSDFASFCGDGGPAFEACLHSPTDVAVDITGNVFIADRGNNRIRRVDAKTGIINTVAGNGTEGFCGDGGPATSACINRPRGITLDGNGNLFIADAGNERVRRVDVATGIVTTVAGGALGFFPNSGNLFISDGNNRVRRVDAATGIITTVAGGRGDFDFCGDGGPATEACLAAPVGVAIDLNGNMYIGDSANHRVRRVY